MNRKIATRLAAAIALTTGLGVAMSVPAQADGGGGSSRSGQCSMNSRWELKADSDGGNDHNRRVEIEAKIDSNRGGDLWNWSFTDNGTVVAMGQRRTERGSQSFDVRRQTHNQAGADTIVLNATNTVTGETCLGQVVLRGGHDHR